MKAFALVAVAAMLLAAGPASACGPSATVSFADAVAVPVVPTNAVFLNRSVFAADFGFRRLAFADAVAFQPVVAVRAPFVSVAIGRGGLGLRAARFPLARAVLRRALFPRLARLGL